MGRWKLQSVCVCVFECVCVRVCAEMTGKCCKFIEKTEKEYR